MLPDESQDDESTTTTAATTLTLPADSSSTGRQMAPDNNETLGLFLVFIENLVVKVLSSTELNIQHQGSFTKEVFTLHYIKNYI